MNRIKEKAGEKGQFHRMVWKICISCEVREKN